nr:hypothetical protein [Micromonospora provocatoris]
MNRDLARGLTVAWALPEFRDGLRHLVDLDEVTVLLAALSLPDRDREVERSALGLLRSGLDSTEVREAVLLLLERDTVRRRSSPRRWSRSPTGPAWSPPSPPQPKIPGYATRYGRCWTAPAYAS